MLAMRQDVQDFIDHSNYCYVVLFDGIITLHACASNYVINYAGTLDERGIDHMARELGIFAAGKAKFSYYDAAVLTRWLRDILFEVKS